MKERENIPSVKRKKPMLTNLLLQLLPVTLNGIKFGDKEAEEESWLLMFRRQKSTMPSSFPGICLSVAYESRTCIFIKYK
jgi:hypothetical protein